MILHSTRPAVFVLAMDDCEVQASSGGLPNFCSVLWKNSDGPEALAQDRPLLALLLAARPVRGRPFQSSCAGL